MKGLLCNRRKRTEMREMNDKKLEEIGEMLEQIKETREKLLHEFIVAHIADRYIKGETFDINEFELVQKQEKNEITWHFRKRESTDEIPKVNISVDKVQIAYEESGDDE